MTHRLLLRELQRSYERIQRLYSEIEEEKEFISALKNSCHKFGSLKVGSVVSTPRGVGMVVNVEASYEGFRYTISDINNPERLIYIRECLN